MGRDRTPASVTKLVTDLRFIEFIGFHPPASNFDALQRFRVAAKTPLWRALRRRAGRPKERNR
jgi:hypothetical protein